MRYYDPDTDRVYVGRIVGTVLLALAAAWLITAAVWGLGVATAGIYGRGEAHRQINSPENRIVAYDHFYNLCASVQGLEGSITAQRQALVDTSDVSEQERLRANIAGLEAARAQAIAQYNADARKQYTIGQFRASDLPYQLDEGQEVTTC